MSASLSPDLLLRGSPERGCEDHGIGILLAARHGPVGMEEPIIGAEDDIVLAAASTCL
jgi:hypothetical protein